METRAVTYLRTQPRAITILAPNGSLFLFGAQRANCDRGWTASSTASEQATKPRRGRKRSLYMSQMTRDRAAIIQHGHTEANGADG